MKRLIFLLIIMSLVFSFCSSKTDKVKTEIDFANKMAMSGLWKEAYFRWQKALTEGDESALLHNNMAVALEEMGKFKEAEKEYEKALKLAPNSTFIKTNLKSLKRLLEGKESKEMEKSKSKKGKGRKKGIKK
ncbi:MAG: tetratricopeptide repeat protein [Candidatus Aminicenantes bacterium]|nr:tetratricopeptide repeat protein [Candidatus Aminicenantes bacterium]